MKGFTEWEGEGGGRVVVNLKGVPCVGCEILLPPRRDQDDSLGGGAGVGAVALRRRDANWERRVGKCNFRDKCVSVARATARPFGLTEAVRLSPLRSIPKCNLGTREAFGNWERGRLGTRERRGLEDMIAFGEDATITKEPEVTKAVTKHQIPAWRH